MSMLPYPETSHQTWRPPPVSRRQRGSSYATVRQLSLLKDILFENGPLWLKILITERTAGTLIGVGGSSVFAVEESTATALRISSKKVYFPGTNRRIMVIAAPGEEPLNASLEKILQTHIIVEPEEDGVYISVRSKAAIELAERALSFVHPLQFSPTVNGEYIIRVPINKNRSPSVLVSAVSRIACAIQADQSSTYFNRHIDYNATTGIVNKQQVEANNYFCSMVIELPCSHPVVLESKVFEQDDGLKATVIRLDIGDNRRAAVVLKGQLARVHEALSSLFVSDE
ncbi:hypothetical protein FOL47_000374 [Perkinsus chesapeaki]|uniref:Uncharacterized protein n=1 Tax=Perkinsus chesapeaki TaxID=330153 RepID=A0A7J6KWI1_PERCH|nr:hypothetical protein FOL47_000374 [Perkinsus chesapeaki]